MAKTAWGIEAGTSNVKAVKLSVDGRGAVTLEDVSMISLANYRSTGADDQAALLGALREFVQEKSIRPSDVCYISLPGRNAFSRVVELPPVSDDKIRETIANEARGQIPIKLEEAVWDYQRISSSDSGSVEVNLYAVKRDVVDNLISVCRMAGLPVRGIQLAPLGIYNFIKHELDETISNGCVCIDIGTENTDLVVVDGEKAYLRVVPTAGNDITKALIMKDNRLKPAMAEQLKVNPGAVVKKLNDGKKDPKWPDVAHVLEAMKAPLRELVADIHRSVGFYKNSNPNAQTDHLVMMGNGSRLMNIDKFLRQQLQFDVTRVAALSSITIARTLDPAIITDRVPALVVPIGLALQALGVGGVSRTNLIPEDMIVEEQLSRARPMAILGGAIIALCGLAAFLSTLPNASAAESALKQLKESESKVKRMQSEWQKQLGRDARLEAWVTTANNVRYGEALPMLAYSTFQGVLSTYEMNPNVADASKRGSSEKAPSVNAYRVNASNRESSGIVVEETNAPLSNIATAADASANNARNNRNTPAVQQSSALVRNSTIKINATLGFEQDAFQDDLVAKRHAQSLFDYMTEVYYTALSSKFDDSAAEFELAKILGLEVGEVEVDKKDENGNLVRNDAGITERVRVNSVLNRTP
ncbi:MAG: pilus assembly protein PilM, partial [Planctomycetes bacterium]|nr:pilus assembly protein PilM [Planctomycetota bacterium]